MSEPQSKCSSLRLILFILVLTQPALTIPTHCSRNGECRQKCSQLVPQCADATARVEGGCQVKSGTMPWAVGIGFSGEGASRIGCTGSLISPTLVLSAAHCFYKYPEKTFAVYVGGMNRSADPPEMKLVGVKNYVIYPEIVDNVTLKLYDIALVKLEEPIAEFSDHVRPICLPDADLEVPKGMYVTVAGWGLDSEKPVHKPTNLKSANVPHMPCSRDIPSQICTHETVDKTHVGDSGGPLTYFDHGQEWLMGVNSHRRTKTGAESVFIRVTWALEWIHQYLEPCWIG